MAMRSFCSGVRSSSFFRTWTEPEIAAELGELDVALRGEPGRLLQLLDGV